MSERILVCDNSIPFAGMVAGQLRQKNASVALACREENQPTEGTDRAVTAGIPALSEISWSRSSPLSAKTLLLEARNVLGGMDSALLVFDAQAFYASVVTGKDSIPALLDEYIDAYVFLVRETASFFTRQKRGRLFFALRPFPSRSGLPGSPETVFALAEAAFIRLAEETSVYFGTTGSIPVTCPLVRLGDGDDTEDALWLADKLASPESAKGIGRSGPPRWVKAGSRNLFGILS